MSDFSAAWTLSRSRLLDTIADLDQEQLNWRLHPQALSIGQMAIHVAGVEMSFSSQLAGTVLDEESIRLKSAATDGVVNEERFPFPDDEITPDLVRTTLDKGKAALESIIANPSEEVRSKEIISALGPVITGEGAFARLAFHSAYHQGQAYLIRTAPGFPS